MSRISTFAMLPLLAVLIAGCSFVGRGGDSSGTLVYAGPTEQTVPVGQTVPGSNIRYTGYSDDGAEVLIDGQRAVKKPGDSLDWEGSPVPGTEVSMAQRVLFANSSRLQTVGTVKVTVRNVRPEPAQFPDQPAYSYKVVVTYTVRKGEKVPGTTISYTGKTDEGAQFSGVSGYPYRKMGDSVAWAGRLAGNVFVDMTLRVAAYTDEFVTLGGLATLGITG